MRGRDNCLLLLLPLLTRNCLLIYYFIFSWELSLNWSLIRCFCFFVVIYLRIVDYVFVNFLCLNSLITVIGCGLFDIMMQLLLRLCYLALLHVQVVQVKAQCGSFGLLLSPLLFTLHLRLLRLDCLRLVDCLGFADCFWFADCRFCPINIFLLLLSIYFGIIIMLF